MHVLVCSHVGCSPDDVVIVGIHARRTDYKQWLAQFGQGSIPVDQRYFLRGMELFRERFSKRSPPAFVVVSDDMSWCRSYLSDFQDVFFSTFESNIQDLAVLQLGDHILGR